MLLNAHARILAHDLPAFSISKPLGLSAALSKLKTSSWCLLSLSDVYNLPDAAQKGGTVDMFIPF